MPVRKLTEPEQAEELCWLEPGDPRLARRIAAVWQLSRRLAPRRFPPGVYRHRSVEEANRLADEWDAALCRVLQER